SLEELTRAMGVNRPSLYAAFGNKENLFRKALDCYVRTYAGAGSDAFAAPTARETASTLLYNVADFLGDRRNPPGCLITQTALSCAAGNEPIRDELNKRRDAVFTALRKRFQRSKREGDLPENTDPTALARYVSAAVYGM